MIRAIFYRQGGMYSGVRVSGHAGYADKGMDIVCAAVTSAVQLTANALTEVLRVPAEVEAGEEDISIRLPDECDSAAKKFLEALFLHLKLLAEDYGQNLNITTTDITEV